MLSSWDPLEVPSLGLLPALPSYPLKPLSLHLRNGKSEGELEPTSPETLSNPSILALVSNLCKTQNTSGEK